jgi:hypothetical protein
MQVDRSIGAKASMSEREMTTVVHRTIIDVASEHLGLLIGSIEVNRGWGEILYVRIRARMADRSAREQMEQRLTSAMREALVGQRTSVSISWTG